MISYESERIIRTNATEMITTGKCRKDLESWLLNYFDDQDNDFVGHYEVLHFESLPIGMQWGVLQEFFCEKGKMNVYLKPTSVGFSIYIDDNEIKGRHLLTEKVVIVNRKMARIKAIELADEIYNNEIPRS